MSHYLLMWALKRSDKETTALQHAVTMRFHSIHQCLVEKAPVQVFTFTVTSKYCPPPPPLVVLDSVLHLVLVSF